MVRWFRIWWIGLVVAITAAIYVPLAERSGAERAHQRGVASLTEAMGLVRRASVDPPDAGQVTHATISGMLKTLDPHSYFMDEREFRSLREEQRGSFYGIGAVIQQQPDGVAVVDTVQGGPSARVGLRSGDYIREVDGKSMEGLTSTAVMQRLHGDRGTAVDLGLQRAGFQGLIHVSIARSRVSSTSVEHAFMLTPDTGLIVIKDFGETTSDEFDKAVRELRAQGMTALVLDLRNNGGGILDAATGICDQLLGPGELIVTQRGRDPREVVETRTPWTTARSPFPLVVLVNRGTASASEIVAGAVQDHDRGLVVGRTTWGKGLVQVLMPINRTRSLALTTARYFTPSGRCIQRDYKHGIDDYLLPEDGSEPLGRKGPASRTDLGRTVFGGGGITPDYPVEAAKLTPFVGGLRDRAGAFFAFAVAEKGKRGIRPGQEADDALLARFKAFLKERRIDLTEAEWREPRNQADMRTQLAMELQNVTFGVEAGFRFLAGRDPQVRKALEVMPEAAAMLARKRSASGGTAG